LEAGEVDVVRCAGFEVDEGALEVLTRVRRG
jgi:hypothetical protein